MNRISRSIFFVMMITVLLLATGTVGRADPHSALEPSTDHAGQEQSLLHPGQSPNILPVQQRPAPGPARQAPSARSALSRLSRTPGYFVAEETKHFHLYAPKRSRVSLQELGLTVEGILTEISAGLGIAPRGPVRVFILARDEDAAQLTFRLPDTPEWSIGYAVARIRTIVLKTAHLESRIRSDVFSTFRHELVHILVADAVGPYGTLIPRWFNEGTAMVYTKAWGLKDVVNLSKHLITRRYIPLSELESNFPRRQADAQVAYAESFLFVSHLRRKAGPQAPGEILRLVGKGAEFRAAFREVTGQGLEEFESAWLVRLKWRYRYIPIATSSVTLWMALTFLFLLGYWRKRRRNREILEQWDEEEGGRIDTEY